MIEKLEIIARDIRKSIVLAISKLDYVDCELRAFPDGSCLISSTIAGLYLLSLSIGSVLLVQGERPIPNNINIKSHFWLLVNEQYIVDITPSQFEDCNDKVIVTKKSEFHDTFEIVLKRLPDKSDLDVPGSMNSYQSIRDEVFNELRNT